MRAGQRKGPGTPAGALRTNELQTQPSPFAVSAQGKSRERIEVALAHLRETVRTVDPADMDSFYHRTVRAWGKQHFLSYEFEQFVSKVAIDQKGGAR